MWRWGIKVWLNAFLCLLFGCVMNILMWLLSAGRQKQSSSYTNNQHLIWRLNTWNTTLIICSSEHYWLSVSLQQNLQSPASYTFRMTNCETEWQLIILLKKINIIYCSWNHLLICLAVTDDASKSETTWCVFNINVSCRYCRWKLSETTQFALFFS